jgi:hypothetical protein
MSIIINNKSFEIPELKTISYLDGIGWIKEATDKSPRSRPIKNIVCHTNEGINSKLIQGTGPNSTIDEALARYQVNTEREVGWDYTVDLNGDVTVQNDPVKYYTWQAGSFNPISLGIEMVQQNQNGTRVLYLEQINKTVLLIDFLTAALGIQRQIPWDKIGNKPILTQIPRIKEFKNFFGIIGHVQITKDRGKGDPGEHIFYALKEAGYECFDLSLKEDLEVWKERQKNLGIDSDGIPGQNTVNALKQKGLKHGMWIKRPIDDLISF